ncbi:hypothetical protein [Sorangium sp. So ce385]|uniref:hypothetical protein n=1 Tax=Sorangium sp. So ce385 TaxID=3133308 RepID=UPI003F5B2E4C
MRPRGGLLVLAALASAGALACDQILDLPERSQAPDGGAGRGGREPARDGGRSPVDEAHYSFEVDEQGWEFCGEMAAGIAPSSANAYAGERALAVTLQAGAGGLRCQGAQDPARMQLVFVRSPDVSPGKNVTFHVWLPASSRIVSVQPYLLMEDGLWEGDYRYMSNLDGDAWNEFTVRYRSGSPPIEQLGVELVIDPSAAWSGVCYIDSVGW